MSDTIIPAAGGCCAGSPRPALVLPEPAAEAAAPCCGTTAEAERAGACCGAAAKEQAVAAEQGCCG